MSGKLSIFKEIEGKCSKNRVDWIKSEENIKETEFLEQSQAKISKKPDFRDKIGRKDKIDYKS